MATDLKKTITQLMKVKAEENELKVQRIKLEEEIEDILWNKPGVLEGSVSSKNKEETLKITVTRKLDRKLDEKLYEQHKDDLPEGVDPVDMKPKLSIKRLKAIQEANPGAYDICTYFITTKPAKTAVKIEEVK